MSKLKTTLFLTATVAAAALYPNFAAAQNTVNEKTARALQNCVTQTNNKDASADIACKIATAAVLDVGAAFGGGADYANGVLPTYTINGTTYRNVGGAFTAIDTGLSAGSIGVLKYNTTTNSYNLKDFLSSGVGVKIDGVGAGSYTSTSQQAINGGQFYKLNEGLKANFKSSLGFNIVPVEGDIPSYTIQGKIIAGIGPSIEALNTGLTTVNTTITNQGFGKVQALNGLWLTLTNQADISKTGIGAAQQLSNLAAGTISADSTYAVNGAQLYATNNNVATNATNILANANKITTNTANIATNTTNIATNTANIKTNATNIATVAANASAYFGSSANVLTGTAPAYTIQKGVYNNVGSAFAAVDDSINKIIANQSSNTSPVRRTSGDNLALIDETGSAANPGKAQKLTNLADGTIAAGSSDAVNGSQLNTTNTNVATNTAAISTNTGKISENAANIATNTTNIATNTANIKTNATDIATVAANTSVYFGGGANVLTGTAPAYTIQKGIYNNVGDAFAATDSAIDGVRGDIENIIADTNKGNVGPVRRTSGDNLALIDETGSAANPGKAQKLTNLADGTIAAGSSDAVNGSQLNTTNTNVATNAKFVANYFGAGADYNNGVLTSPNFIIQGSNYNNVGSAFVAIDNSLDNLNNKVDKNTQNIENINNQITDIKGGSDKNVKRVDDTTLALTDKDGGRSTPQKLTNVDKGNISKGSTDAVNGDQLNDTNTRIDGIDNRVGDLEGQIGSVGEGAKNAVKYDADKDGNKMNSITLNGADPSTPVAIHNVASGKVEKNSTDAVNGGDLWQTATDLRGEIKSSAADTLEAANEYSESLYKNLNSKLKRLRGRSDAGIAGATAIATLSFDTLKDNSISGGFGIAKNKIAGAMGYQRNFSDKWRARVTVSISDQYIQGGGSVGFSW